jgi:6,7-dimethyl-8-ribityllumazine synthase
VSYKNINVSPNGNGLSAGVIVARFNRVITDRLLEGALSGLQEKGILQTDITVYWVPGAFEIPTVAMEAAKTGEFDFLIAIGAVIRGETSHFDYVSLGVTNGISSIPIETGVPVAFGVLTTDNMEQAMARSGPLGSNRGYDAALSGIETANVIKELRG